MDVATTLLVVVDLQRGFVTDDTRPVLPVVGGLVQRWTAAGGAVLLTQFVNRPGSAYERLVHWAEMQGPPQTDIVPQLAGYLGHPRVVVLEKNIYTLLSEEGAAAVQSGGWTDLVSAGSTPTRASSRARSTRSRPVTPRGSSGTPTRAPAAGAPTRLGCSWPVTSSVSAS